jgi:hypothetical protein
VQAAAGLGAEGDLGDSRILVRGAAKFFAGATERREWRKGPGGSSGVGAAEVRALKPGGRGSCRNLCVGPQISALRVTEGGSRWVAEE